MPAAGYAAYSSGRTIVLQVRMPAEGAPLSCPFPTKAAAAKVAVRDTIVHALINRDFLAFFMNWYKHLQKLKVRTVCGDGLW